MLAHPLASLGLNTGSIITSAAACWKIRWNAWSRATVSCSSVYRTIS